jgi:F-type H+-transporting ATPase subunit b
VYKTVFLASASSALSRPARAGESGMPQLDFATYPSQVFWLLIVLVLLYVMLSRYAIPRISSVLEERQDSIADDLEKALSLRKQAALAEESYKRFARDAQAQVRAVVEEYQRKIEGYYKEMANSTAERVALLVQESDERMRGVREQADEAVLLISKDVSIEVLHFILPGSDISAEACSKYVEESFRLSRGG